MRPIFLFGRRLSMTASSLRRFRPTGISILSFPLRTSCCRRMRRREYAIIRHMEKAATDIYTFSELREGGFTYVDKTGLILQLVNKSIGKQFFDWDARNLGKWLVA